jgi:hypothetical protein
MNGLAPAIAERMPGFGFPQKGGHVIQLTVHFANAPVIERALAHQAGALVADFLVIFVEKPALEVLQMGLDGLFDEAFKSEGREKMTLYSLSHHQAFPFSGNSRSTDIFRMQT